MWVLALALASVAAFVGLAAGLCVCCRCRRCISMRATNESAHQSTAVLDQINISNHLSNRLDACLLLCGCVIIPPIKATGRSGHSHKPGPLASDSARVGSSLRDEEEQKRRKRARPMSPSENAARDGVGLFVPIESDCELMHSPPAHRSTNRSLLRLAQCRCGGGFWNRGGVHSINRSPGFPWHPPFFLFPRSRLWG